MSLLAALEGVPPEKIRKDKELIEIYQFLKKIMQGEPATDRTLPRNDDHERRQS